MRLETKVGLRSATGTALVTLAFAALLVPGSLGAQESSYHDVTFTRDIAPILQRSCQTCHRVIFSVSSSRCSSWRRRTRLSRWW